MKPLQIDFSGRSRLFALNTSDPISLLFAGLLVLGAVMLCAGASVALRLNTQSAHLAQAIAQIESTTQSANDETSAQNGQLSVEETQAVNGAVVQLNYPWLALFNSLEKHAKVGVSLVSVETGMARQGAKIVVDAPSIGDALSYVQALKLEPMFANVTLVKQETIGTGDNANAMRFTLEAPFAGTGSALVARRGGS